MRWVKRLGIVMGAIAALLLLWVAAGALVYGGEYVGRVLTSRESSVDDYLYTFPLSPLSASATPFFFDDAPDEDSVREALESALGVSDLDVFLAESETQAFIVIKDDRILYEGYFNGTRRDSMVTSFSVAKSFDSALIGIAIDDGFIGSSR